MKVENVEVYSHITNCPVIRVPERKFPGILIQGDSMYVLLQTVEEIIANQKGGDMAEVSDGLEYLRGILSNYVSAYEEVLKTHDIPLPYVRQ